MYGTFWRSVKAIGPAVVLMVVTVVVVVAGTAVSASAQAPVGTASRMPAAERQSLSAAGAFTDHPVQFMLLGDSLSLTLAVGLEQQSVPRYGVQVINREELGCDLDDLNAIVDGNVDSPESNCRYWRTLWKSYIDQIDPEVVGVLVGRWDITDHIDNGKVVYIGQPAWDAHLYDEINQAVSILSSKGARVVLFTMPYIDPAEAPNGSTYPENQSSRVDEFNQILAQVVKHRSNVATLVDLNKQLDPGGTYQAVIDGVTVRWADGIHISKPGGEWLQPFILPTVAKLGLAVRDGTPGN